MPGALSPTDLDALAALVEAIFPTDEHGPGAVSLGVIDFLVSAVTTDTPSDLEPLQTLATAALAVSGGSAGLTALDEPGRAALLASLDQAHPHALELLRRRTIEGLFADPSYGGNRNEAGWRLLGYPGPKGTYTAADQELT